MMTFFTFTALLLAFHTCVCAINGASPHYLLACAIACAVNTVFLVRALRSPRDP
jgi:hypothetical protein